MAERPSGRERHYHLTAAPLADIEAWLHPFERYWRDRLHSLAEFPEDDPT